MQSINRKSLYPAIFFRASGLDPIMIRRRFRKVPVFTVHTVKRKRRFQKIPFCRERFQKFAFSVTVFIGYVWTEDVSAKKKLRFQTKTDTCGRGLRNIYIFTHFKMTSERSNRRAFFVTYFYLTMLLFHILSGFPFPDVVLHNLKKKKKKKQNLTPD